MMQLLAGQRPPLFFFFWQLHGEMVPAAGKIKESETGHFAKQ